MCGQTVETRVDEHDLAIARDRKIVGVEVAGEISELGHIDASGPPATGGCSSLMASETENQRVAGHPQIRAGNRVRDTGRCRG
jgi:hypothetical protein